MKISPAGLDLIKEFEGLELVAYPDPGSGGDPWTIGYGHTKGVKEGDTCTEAEADHFLLSDVSDFEDAVTKLVHVPIDQYHFDALVSFTFNVGEVNFGASTLLKKLNDMDYEGASEEFPRWRYASGKVLAGLVRRRIAEAALFIRGI